VLFKLGLTKLFWNTGTSNIIIYYQLGGFRGENPVSVSYSVVFNEELFKLFKLINSIFGDN